MTTLIDIDKLAQSVGMVKDGDHWFSSGSDDFDVKHEHLLKFAAAVVASISPQSSMSWQEGYAAGRNAATLEFLKQLRQLHDAYSLQSEPPVKRESKALTKEEVEDAWQASAGAKDRLKAFYDGLDDRLWRKNKLRQYKEKAQ